MTIRGSQTPRVGYAPPSAQNSWAEVVQLCQTFGLELDGWQQQVLKGMLGEAVDGSWAASQVGVCVPRQSGKGELIVALELAGLLLFGERLIVHSAHEYRTAADGFRRIWSYFSNYDSLSKRVSRFGTATSREFIELKSGQALRFFARSKGAGRGFTADRLILDEAQELSEDAWSAILPTIAAVQNPQVVLLGTAPSPAMDSTVFTRFRKNGLSGAGRQAWFEWSADPAGDPADPEMWAQANPAMGLRGLTTQKIADEHAAMDEESFSRERLGIWTDASTSAVIPAEAWQAVCDPDSRRQGAVVFSVDAEVDRSSASIAVAGINQHGMMHVELVDKRPGVAWAADRLVELYEKHSPKAIVLDSLGPAGSLIPALQQAGIEPFITTADHMKRACGGFYDAVMGTVDANGVVHRTLAHTGLEPRLDAAVAQGAKRTLGDAWAWRKRGNRGDLSPLVAVTLAHYGMAQKQHERSNKAAFF